MTELAQLIGEAFTLHLERVDTLDRLTWEGYVIDVLTEHRVIVLSPIGGGPEVTLIRAATRRCRDGALLTTVDGHLCRVRGATLIEVIELTDQLDD